MHIVASPVFPFFCLSDPIPAQIICLSSILQIIAAFPLRYLPIFPLSGCTVKHASTQAAGKFPRKIIFSFVPPPAVYSILVLLLPSGIHPAVGFFKQLFAYNRRYGVFMHDPIGLGIFYDLFAFKIIMLAVLNNGSFINRVPDHIPYTGWADHLSVPIAVSFLIKDLRTTMRTISIGGKFKNCADHSRFLQFDIIVIKSQDRLMRNTKDWYLFLDRMQKNRKQLYIYLEHKFYTPDDALLTGIKAILAEEYSRELSKKINNAHRNRQKEGLKTNTSPLYYASVYPGF